MDCEFSIKISPIDRLQNSSHRSQLHTSRKDGLNHGRKILGKLVRLIVETNTLTGAWLCDR